MNQNTKKWLGVILSAVVLGLSVVYLINMWMPECPQRWILWGTAAIIALRSVIRIGQLAKEAGRDEALEDNDRE
ncbi:MAG: hypothetical protein IKV29_06350 [Alistipes sp.]|nr:hypothetical protein [Alistipes sp.]